MTNTETSRRALIGGAGLAAVALAAPATAALTGTSSTAIFNRRLAAFHDANNRFVAANKMPHCPDALGDALCHSAADAYEALIDTPAPDFAGVSAKLDALARWSTGSVIPNEEVQTIADDARRLLKGEG